ncbi:MAG: type II secretion system protein [Legionellales bacterium]|nr:type II secretion system protein [Legionellales bacterium]
MNKIQNNILGFTIIELIMVIVIIAILGIFAIPRIFLSLDKSKNTAVEAILTSTRSNISAYVTKQIASSNTSSYPTITDLQTPGVVLENEILANPFNNLNTIRNADGEYTSSPPVTDSDSYGWAYDQTNGKFWANTNYNDENEL